MNCRSQHARPEIVEKLKTTWEQATPREKQVFAEHARSAALQKIKQACDAITKTNKTQQGQ
jgi:hypothetical protein